MKSKFLITILAFCLIVPMLTSPASAADSKNSWYIGFGLGSGTGGWTYNDNEKVTFSDLTKGSTSSTCLGLQFGVGGNINDYLSLGLDISAIRQQADTNFYGTTVTQTVQFNNYLGVITFFPIKDYLLLRAGLGLAAAQYELGIGSSKYSQTFSGSAGLIGVGIAIPVSGSFHLGFNVDYSVQKYSSSGTVYTKDSHFVLAYLTLYWY
jgi:hypothetical protein